MAFICIVSRCSFSWIASEPYESFHIFVGFAVFSIGQCMGKEQFSNRWGIVLAALGIIFEFEDLELAGAIIIGMMMVFYQAIRDFFKGDKEE